MTRNVKVRGGGNLSSFLSGLLILTFLVSGTVQAATINWTGTTSSAWSTATNWSSSSVPTSSDTAQVGTAYTSYTNALEIKTGDAITVTRADFSGGAVKITGGSMTVSGDRLRIGGAASMNVAFSGGTLNLNGGLGLGGGKSATFNSTLTVSDSARLNVSSCFLLHGHNVATLNQTGGVIVNKSGWSQVGEGAYEANVNLTGGAFYNSSTGIFYVGRNNLEPGATGEINSGKGTITVDGGQFYAAGTMRLGRADAATDRYGKVELKSGIFSAKEITITNRGTLSLTGGTFLAGTVNGDLTNAGSTVEIASSYAIDTSKIDALASTETWFSKYQKGTVGTLNVTGTYAQSAGTLNLDITNATTYDTLTANAFNVTGGTLNVNVTNYSQYTKETTFNVFGDSPTGTLNFTNITADGGATNRWKIMDGKLVRFSTETFVWNGSTSSDWNTRANWNSNDSSYAPEILDIVKIGSGFGTSYTNELTIKDGDSLQAKQMYFSGGKMSITGGTLTVGEKGTTEDCRWRVGNAGSANTELNISGGTLNLNGGFAIGGNGDMEANDVTISGDARLNVNYCFVVHGNSNGTLTQTGGVIFNSNTSFDKQYSQIGEGPNEANVYLNGGAFYNVTNLYVGRNMGGNNAGKGLLSIDGGQMYVGGTLIVGSSLSTAASDRYGKVELKSGILSAKTINFGTKTGELKLTGGTFLARTVNGNLTNAGSTIEIAPESSFTPTEANVNALASTETWFSKYQSGKVGTLNVTGTYAQSAGTLNLDVTNATSYDKLTAGSFNVTGGTLNVNVTNASQYTSEAIFNVFGDSPTGTLNFSNITANGSTSTRWKIMDGKLVRFYAETFVWNGSTSSDWNTRANWNSNGSSYAPEVLDTVQVGSCYGTSTNELTIKDGDSVQAKIMYLNGGKMSVTGGTLTVATDRLRIGNAGTVNTELNVSGGTVNLNGGLGIGGLTSDTLESFMTVSDNARLNVNSIFSVHGFSKGTLTQTGGVIFNATPSTNISQIGEGSNEANVYLKGGAFYNATNLCVGRNRDGNNAGKGLLSVDGGQMYIGGTLTVGSSLASAAADCYGTVEVKSGILSANTIKFGTKTGDLKLTGGKFLAQKVNGNLTNVGSTVEIAANFAPTEAQVNALGTGETWYSKYQEGTVGTLNVTGTYSQTGGSLELDLNAMDSYDVLTAGLFNVTGGDLVLNVSDELASSLKGGEKFQFFGTSPKGTLDFANILSSFGSSAQWSLGADGTLTYYNANQIPEPATWALLLIGLGLLCKAKKK